MLIFWAVLWYVFGVAILLHVCWWQEGVISVRDVLISLLCGIIGPATIAIYLVFSQSPWLNVKLAYKEDSNGIQQKTKK